MIHFSILRWTNVLASANTWWQVDIMEVDVERVMNMMPAEGRLSSDVVVGPSVMRGNNECRHMGDWLACKCVGCWKTKLVVRRTSNGRCGGPKWNWLSSHYCCTEIGLYFSDTRDKSVQSREILQAYGRHVRTTGGSTKQWMKPQDLLLRN